MLADSQPRTRQLTNLLWQTTSSYGQVATIVKAAAAADRRDVDGDNDDDGNDDTDAVVTGDVDADDDACKSAIDKMLTQTKYIPTNNEQ